MRFAITAIDRYLGVFEMLVRAGWKPVKLFTLPMRSLLDSHHAVVAFAEKHKIPIQLSRMTSDDLRLLGEEGCDALVVASYNWKTPDWQPYLKYGINFHASPLPEARGPYPAVRAILEQRKSWAIACHKLTQQMDHGDVLTAETFPLSHDECHESLDIKIQMAAKRLASKVATDFEKLWTQAKPQAGGSTWPRWTYEDQIIDFTKPVEHILRQVRAFGSIETLARVNNTVLSVRRAFGWTEAHDSLPGHVVHIYNRFIVMAATDGYIVLTDWNIAAPDLAAEIEISMNAGNIAG